VNENEKPEKVSLLFDPPFYEVLKLAVSRRKGKFKISKLIRQILASDNELRAIAAQMGVNLDDYVDKPLGGDRRSKQDTPTISQNEARTGIVASDDPKPAPRPALPHSAQPMPPLGWQGKSFSKASQTGSNGKRRNGASGEE
jgi:hypothetical protein